ncbi:TetR/AcrR family transcriptional regulator [Jannaschia pohangensis]|uniref:Transcriptional regulator, TetR family n=1 Tax=Jannaschia pohangensis TaxID=390807 RepID=A0A1I3V2P4_9RHOB|nr:TetR/AcrR family transcriptional regulator [Jannaschia pohangensis]SFJ89410.1 transcriptional regulator, TetR family [Jannaschia pohangensis]
MVKRKTGDKLGDIRRATIAEVVECGSSAASVNAIARRAGLAVGTIYRYYGNKENLLRSVQMAVKTDLHQQVMAAAASQSGSKAIIRAMWFRILQYAHENPDAFLYSEVLMNSALLTEDERGQIDAMLNEGMRYVERAIEDGSVRPGDLRVIRILLAAPALHLGRAAARSGNTPDLARAEETFDLCWKAIAT